MKRQKRYLGQRSNGGHDDGHRDAQLRTVPRESEGVVTRARRNHPPLFLLLRPDEEEAQEEKKKKAMGGG